MHGQLDARFCGRIGTDERSRGSPHAGVEPVRMDGRLLDASRRLIECFADPMDREVVGPTARSDSSKPRARSSSAECVSMRRPTAWAAELITNSYQHDWTVSHSCLDPR